MAFPSYDELYRQDLVDVSKALTTSNTAAIPVFLPEKITALANYKNPFRAELQRKNQPMGSVYKVVRAASGTADWLADGTDPTDRTGDPADTDFAFKRVAARIKITQFRRAMSGTGRPGIDLFVDEIRRKVMDIRDVEDLAYCVGASATGQNNPQGLKYLIGDAQRVLMGSCTAGTTLTLKKIDETMDKCAPMSPDFAVTSLAIRRELHALLQDQQRYVNVTTTARGGFALMTYADAYVFPSTNMSITQNFNGTSEGDETGGTTGSIYFGNFDTFYVGILANADMKVTPTMLGTTIWDSVDIESWETTVLEHTGEVSKLIGIGYS